MKSVQALVYMLWALTANAQQSAYGQCQLAMPFSFAIDTDSRLQAVAQAGLALRHVFPVMFAHTPMPGTLSAFQEQVRGSALLFTTPIN